MKRFISLIFAATMFFIPSQNLFTAVAEEEIFFDDFSGDRLDTSNWLIAKKTGAEQSALTEKK